jgi:CheY-like chemotaxis protein
LIVDDDDEVRFATQAVMERQGYDVIAVGSGAEALAFLARQTPDLMLLDLEMGDMNGWEVLGAIRGDPRFGSVQTVIVTGSRQGVSPGVPVLRKPFKLEALLEVLAA